MLTGGQMDDYGKDDLLINSISFVYKELIAEIYDSLGIDILEKIQEGVPVPQVIRDMATLEFGLRNYDLNKDNLVKYQNHMKWVFDTKDEQLTSNSTGASGLSDKTLVENIVKTIPKGKQADSNETVIQMLPHVWNQMFCSGGSADIRRIIAGFNSAGVNGIEAWHYSKEKFDKMIGSAEKLGRATTVVKVMTSKGIPQIAACACVGKMLNESSCDPTKVMQMEKEQQTTNSKIPAGGYGAGIWQWTDTGGTHGTKLKWLARADSLGFARHMQPNHPDLPEIESYSLEEQASVLSVQIKADPKCVKYMINGSPENALCAAVLECHGWGKHGYDAVDCVKTYGVTYKCIGYEQIYHTPALVRTVHSASPSMHHKYGLCCSVFEGALLDLYITNGNKLPDNLPK